MIQGGDFTRGDGWFTPEVAVCGMMLMLCLKVLVGNPYMGEVPRREFQAEAHKDWVTEYVEIVLLL
jgi:hypothetical protein